METKILKAMEEIKYKRDLEKVCADIAIESWKKTHYDSDYSVYQLSVARIQAYESSLKILREITGV